MMKLIELLDKANLDYPDGFLINYYEKETGKEVEGSGDTLAQFIVRELRETFDESKSDEEQIDRAVSVLNNAVKDLNRVVLALL